MNGGRDRKMWISCSGFTSTVIVDENDIIIDYSTIAKRFVGKTLFEFANWAEKEFGETDLIELPHE